jgi:flagellar export protein FliJ
MKPFSFRLESVLTYRQYLEKRAQRDVHNARKEQKNREIRVRGLGDKRVEIARQCSTETSQGIDVPRYRMYRSFLETLNSDLESALVSLEKGEEEIKAKVATLKRESVRKKTLEVLRDIQRKRHLQTAENQYQKEMDELVILRRGIKR